jgi:hypothetical protein
MNDLELLVEEATGMGFGPFWMAEVKRAVRTTLRGRFANARHIISEDDLIQDVILLKLLESEEQQKILDLANDIGHVRALLIRLVRNRIDELREHSYRRNVFDRIVEEFKGRGRSLSQQGHDDVRDHKHAILRIRALVKQLPLRRILGEEERSSPLFSSESLAHLANEIEREGLVLTRETIWEGLAALTLFLPRLSNTVVDQTLVAEQEAFAQPEKQQEARHIWSIAEEVVAEMSQDAKECYAAVIQGFGKAKSMSDLAAALGLKNRQNAAKRRDSMEAEMEAIIGKLALPKNELLEVLRAVSVILYPEADLNGLSL